MPLKSLENLLEQGGTGELGGLVRRAREMDSLVNALHEALGGDAGASIRAANVRDDGTLIVLVSTSAWAARLRFETDTMLEAARSVGVKAQACKIRVSQDT